MDEEQLSELIERVINDYLDLVGDENLDTQDLADNVAARIKQAESAGNGQSATVCS